MSGHSKWATIKRKKEATDSKRSNMYAKLLRAVEVAASEGGGNVEANMTLASAVEKARSFSVPSDNIERAIKRAAGELGDGAAVRRDRVRGLRARRDRAADRGADRQPQPNRPGGPARVHPQRREPRRDGTVAWQFTAQGRDRRREGGAPRRGRDLLELALDGGAEDLTDSESQLGHRHARLRTSRPCRRRSRSRRPDLLGGDLDAAAVRRSRSRAPRPTACCG